VTGPSAPGRGIVAAVDVHYPPDGGARAAVVLADDASFRRIVGTRTVWVPQVARTGLVSTVVGVARTPFRAATHASLSCAGRGVHLVDRLARTGAV
jgi:hypothetical protein